MLVLLAISVSGAYPNANPYSAVNIWRFDEGSGTIASDYLVNASLGLNGANWSSDGKFSNAFDFAQTYNGTNNSYSWITAAGQSRTICAWLKVRDYSSCTDPSCSWFSTKDASDNTYTMFIKTGGLMEVCVADNGWTNYACWHADNALSSLDWIHVCVRKQYGVGANMSWTINGSIDWPYSLRDSDGEAAATTEGAYNSVHIGKDRNKYHPFDGMIDDEIVFDRWLSNNEILNIYNDNFSATPTDAINLSASKPVNGAYFNTNLINLNLTVNSTYNFNCSLYINSTLNETTTHTAGNDVFVNYSKNFSDGTYNFYVYCVQFNDTTQNETTSTNNFIIDTMQPVITWESSLSDNKKVILQGTNLTSWVAFTDDNLYNYNVSINGTSAYTNGSISGGFANQTINYDTDGWPYGTYSVFARACDGHTAKELKKDWTAQKNNKELKYDVKKGWIKIVPKDKTKISKVDTEKLIDRYNFDFEFNTLPSSVTFVVQSDYAIQLVTGSDYLAHMVIPELEVWIDFENVQTRNAQVKVINDKTVEVTLNNLRNNKVVFNSVGELNCNNATRYFYILNYTQDFNANVLVTQPVNFSLNVTTNTSMITDINATLYYNNTEYFSAGTLVTSYYSLINAVTIPLIGLNYTTKDFYWTIKADDYYFNTSNNTQHLYTPNLDNCTNYTLAWVNYTILDEDTELAQNGMLDYLFNYWIYDYSSTLSGTTTNTTSNHAFCIYPDWANFTTNISIDYMLSLASFTVRSYSTNNFNIDNVTDTIILYLLGNPTEITIKVVDEADNKLQNVFIEAYKYDVATGTSTLVESQYTDSEGKALFGLKKGTTRYNFKFYQDGVLKLATTSFKLFSTEYTYVLREDTTTILSEWINLKNSLDSDLSYTSTSLLVNLEWNNTLTTLATICLNITNTTGNVWSNCSTSNTSSLNHTITLRNTTYYAASYATLTSGTTFILDTLSIDLSNEWSEKWGASFGLSIALIIFVFISMFGLVIGGYKSGANVTIVLGVTALIMLSFLNILPITGAPLLGIVLIALILLVMINKKEEAT